MRGAPSSRNVARLPTRPKSEPAALALKEAAAKPHYLRTIACRRRRRFNAACPNLPAADRLTRPRNARTSIMAISTPARSQSAAATPMMRIRGSGLAASIQAHIRANIRMAPPPPLTRHARTSKPHGECFCQIERKLQAWRDARDWTARKYEMWTTGEKLPSQKPSSMMRCPCGEMFDSHRLENTLIHVPHITAEHKSREVRRAQTVR